MQVAKSAALMGTVLAGMVCATAPPEARQHRGGPVFFLAEAEGSKVVPRSPSQASATGAFVLDVDKRTLTYNLTYHGLENGAPRSIALHNFGAGANGSRLHVICGDGGAPCPTNASATLSGIVDQRSPALEQKLLVEFATGRVYLEIVGGTGQGELRAQLEPNGAMVPSRSFVANLRPAATGQGSGSGTAVLSEVQFATGVASTYYRVTVAGTSGAPQGVAISDVPLLQVESFQPFFSVEKALPSGRQIPSRSSATGGTFTGSYQAGPDRSNVMLASKLLELGGNELGITVRTLKFPSGELVGVFREVH